MKQLSCLFALLTLMSLSILKGQSACTYYTTSIKTEGANLLNLLVDGPVEVKSWDKDYIRVIISVKSNLGKRHVVKHLASNGRFSFETEQFGDVLELSMPNLRKVITVNQELYQDELEFTFQVPNHVEVNEISLPIKMLASNR